MKINLRRLLQEHREPVTGREEIDLSACDFEGFTATKPVVFEFEAKPEGGSVVLAFSLGAELAAECARCLNPLTQTERIEKEYRITEVELDEEFPELPLQPDGTLDTTEFAYQELVLEAPTFFVCSEDCEGLCARCGKPAKECACEPEKEVDPRLQGLLQLLEDE